jgi:dTDP-4-dehydrorhamnose 3,5-epimerase
MRFKETEVWGVFAVEPERHEDERGFFARTWCRQEFAGRGLNADLSQCSISFNKRRGTLRGMHYQAAPHGEVKLVRCTRGALVDVILDPRPGSPTFGRWAAVELTDDNRVSVYIPEGCAHGFQTLADDTEVLYQIAGFYHPEAARGIRWDDPAFAVRWPLPPTVISPKDLAYPDFAPGPAPRR